jgi:phenylpyruvate tautomerase PptA (4-oxalocrotonate tautomerase family)
MPSTLVTARAGWIEDADIFLDAVQAALAETINIPRDAKALRLVELPAAAFPLPPRRTGRYTLVEVTLLPTRTIEQKKALYAALPRELARFGVEAEDVKVILYEVAAENWS